jgi:hypothetical protein
VITGRGSAAAVGSWRGIGGVPGMVPFDSARPQLRSCRILRGGIRGFFGPRRFTWMSGGGGGRAHFT